MLGSGFFALDTAVLVVDLGGISPFVLFLSPMLLKCVGRDRQTERNGIVAKIVVNSM